MMFLDCPAYLDGGGALRCGLPAEVEDRATMRSTDGPVEIHLQAMAQYVTGPARSAVPRILVDYDPGSAWANSATTSFRSCARPPRAVSDTK